nr:hypothetical protein [uncultured Rhodococcus sp.]
MPTPEITRSLSRRAAFRWTAGAVLGTAGLVGAISCSSAAEEQATVDTLTTHLRLARRDATAATALTAPAPELAGALDVVRAERTSHADALAAEIARVAGVPATTAAEAAETTQAQSTTPKPPPTLDELKSYLLESQRGAADSARNESGYRAGLLGSISAACAVELEVVLA